jgi:predicted transcriptional regulator
LSSQQIPQGTIPDLPDLHEVRVIRVRLGWSQQKLARACGLSQSYVNKLERGEANPGYKVVKKIFEIMKQQQTRAGMEKRTAADLMLGDVEYVSTNSTVEEARRLMIKYDYSQLPVIDNGIVKGSITDRKLITLDPSKKGLKIKSVMEPKFHVISPDTKLETVKHMLADLPAVLVDKGDKQYGIITKHTLLKAAKF